MNTGEEVATADVHLVRESQCDRLAGDRPLQIAIFGNNARHGALSARGHHSDAVAFGDRAARDHACKATEVLIRAVYPLHRHPEWTTLKFIACLDRLQEF